MSELVSCLAGLICNAGICSMPWWWVAVSAGARGTNMLEWAAPVDSEVMDGAILVNLKLQEISRDLMGHFDWLVQERCNSSALPMELCLPCINPPIFYYAKWMT